MKYISIKKILLFQAFCVISLNIFPQDTTSSDLGANTDSTISKPPLNRTDTPTMSNNEEAEMFKLDNKIIKQSGSQGVQRISTKTQEEEIERLELLCKILYIWAIVSFLIIIILVLLFFFNRRNKSKKIYELQKRIMDIKNKLNLANGEIINLGKQLADRTRNQLNDTNKDEKISQLNLTIKDLESKINKLQTSQKPTEIIKDELPKINKEKPLENTKEEPIIEKKKIVVPPPVIHKYATYPDDPDGFSFKSIKEKPSNRTIYILTMKGENMAKFRVTENLEVHNHALSNSTYLLAPACNYMNSPNDGNTIKTIADGQLTKTEKGWRITEKVKVEFI